MSLETKAIAMQPRHTQRTLQRMSDAMKGNLGKLSMLNARVMAVVVGMVGTVPVQ